MLARWGSWGAAWEIFDGKRDGWSAERDHLRSLLTDEEWAAASRTTINAHYTDPAIARIMWRTLTDLGVTNGPVLEPGCGSGNFLGLAPATAAMVGVELDPTTAAIARRLYPQASVLTESFADSKFRPGTFDAVIGNVPFSEERLNDRVHNPHRLVMHDHFIVKSLHLTRPGGYVLVLTSAGTMDKRSPAARREMSQLADLAAAIRLPAGAHQRAAGTDVVTDVLLLQRRHPDSPARDATWTQTREVVVDDEAVRMNRWFVEHPDAVLGRLAIGHTQYGRPGLTVVNPTLAQARDQLDDQLRRVAAARGPAVLAPAATAGPVAVVPTELRDLAGTVRATKLGFTVADGYGGTEAFTVPNSQVRETRELLAMRDLIVSVQRMEAASGDDTAELEDARTQLRGTYQRYVDRFGPINRVTVREGKPDAEGNPRITKTLAPAVTRLRLDPHFPRVKALERFNEDTGTARPAGVLTARQIMPRPQPLGAETAADALTIVLDRSGRVDLERIADLLGCTTEQARTELGTTVFLDPAQQRLVPAAEYLSEDVRTKLALARTAAAADPALQVNVTALQEVVPADLGPGQIEPRLGAVWIDAATHQQFLTETLADRTARVANPTPAIWVVEGNKYSVAATSQWGTDRIDAIQLVRSVLEQKEIKVYDTDPVTEARTLNAEATLAAGEKAQALQDRFAEWVWEDPERSDRLATEYNRRFNSLVPRDYTPPAEQHYPGLAASFDPRAHQRAAVARVLAEPSAGLFHVVGAGKTAEMVIAAMELKRLGKARKPVVVVPNHMLEQFGREWLQIYPQAELLSASSEDLTTNRRRQFVAAVASHDWDAVVMTRTAFERLEVSPPARRDYESRTVEQLRAQLDALREGGEASRLTVKRMEKLLLSQENRLRGKLDTIKDPGITFEETGIDYVMVDELHDYKNLSTASSIADAAIPGSKRAQDLHMKIELLRQQHPGKPVFTGATATPIANSLAEAHVMMRYMRPDLLAAAGVEHFDAWAASFAKQVTAVEMDPTGRGFRMKTRLAAFTNIPEMMRIWSMFADVRTAADLDLDTPDLSVNPETGRSGPVTVAVPRSPELADYIEQLGRRAEQVAARAVDPEVDNMLKISTDGRKAALDMRLVAADTPIGYVTKTEVAADRIAAIYAEHDTTIYTDVVTGEEPPRPGGLQLVFCDLSTPSATWNVYAELRDQLAARGVPAEQVRFIHEARNDAEKARMFADARDGRIAVLVGSTSKMGVGTNVQARAVALHHLDCPWRPADLEQRDGRIIRQGNQNKEVSIFRYVVPGSFDGFMWQTVERKQAFIAQVIAGRPGDRTAADLNGGDALSASEAKALASGNPLVMDKVAADADLARLQALAAAHDKGRSALRHRLHGAEQSIAAAERDLPAIQAVAAVATAHPTAGDAFAITVAGQATNSRADAAEVLRAWVDRQTSHRVYSERDHGTLAHLAGVDLTVTERPGVGGKGPDLVFRVADTPRAQVAVPRADVVASGGHGPITRLENLVRSLPQLAADTAAERAAGEHTRTEAAAALTKPFAQADALAAAQQRVTELNDRLHSQAAPTPPSAPAAAASAPPSRAAQQAQAVRDKLAATAGQADRIADRPSAAATDAAELRQRRRRAEHADPEQRPELGH